MKQLLVLVYSAKGLSLFRQNQCGHMERQPLKGERYLPMPNSKEADALTETLEYLEESRIIHSESLVKLVYCPDIKVDLLEKIMIFLLKHSSSLEVLTLLSSMNLHANSMDTLEAKEGVEIIIHSKSYYAQCTKDGSLSLSSAKASKQEAKRRVISEEDLAQTSVHLYVRNAKHPANEQKEKIISNLELKLQTEQEKNKLLQAEQSRWLIEFKQERDLFSRTLSVEMITLMDALGSSEITNKSYLRFLEEDGVFVKKNQPVMELTCGVLNGTKRIVRATDMGIVIYHIPKSAGTIKKGVKLQIDKISEASDTGNPLLCSILGFNKKTKDIKDFITMRRSFAKDIRKKK
jgi:hypothetical protein